MKSKTHRFNRRLDILDFFRANNISPTSPRIEMVYSLMRKPNHFTVEDVLNKLNKKTKVVSRATVYNNLALFVDIGLLNAITVNQAITYYDSNTEEHFHFYDERNKRLIDIPISPDMSGRIKKHIYKNLTRSGKKVSPKSNENLSVVLFG